jgi:DNA-binding NarL/FixJ family response regulator
VIDPNGARLDGRRHVRGDLLTNRERDVLHHVAKGLTRKQMARLMGISIKTIQHHVSHLMDKLDIHDRVELARFAVREGMVEP